MALVEPNVYYEIRSKQRPDLVVDVKGGTTGDSDYVIMYTPNDGYNQQWMFVPVGTTGDKYEIVARHSGRCLDVWNRSMDNRASVIHHGRNGGLNQQWIMKSVGPDGFTLTAAHSGKLLDAEMGAEKDHRLLQYEWNGNPNQVWIVKRK